jgi:hypothetical protein
MQNALAWPERVTLFLFALEAIPLAMLALAAPDAGSLEWFATIATFWRYPFWTLPPIWAILRMIDLLLAGPARRKGYLIVRFLP